jgi:hypothetical protein
MFFPTTYVLVLRICMLLQLIQTRIIFVWQQYMNLYISPRNTTTLYD